MYSEQDYDTIKNRILTNVQVDIDKREGSFVSDMCSPIADELANAYITMDDILSLAFIEDSFDTYLDKRVNEFGIYRKLGSKSTGIIKVVGEIGTEIPNGTIVLANDLCYVVLNDLVLSATENLLYVEALNVGSIYNVLANTEFKLEEACDAKVTSLLNEVAFSGGIDVETDPELRARFTKVVNNPPTSGNKAHYEAWALACNGVSRVSIFPLHAGPGTVKVQIVGAGNTPVTPDIILDVQNYIDENKPIGCVLTVTTPTIMSINVTANIEVDPKFTVLEVTDSFKAELEEYLKTVTTEIVFTKILGILSNTPGVLDFNTPLVNGGTTNITIAEDKLPAIGTVTLTGVI